MRSLFRNVSVSVAVAAVLLALIEGVASMLQTGYHALQRLPFVNPGQEYVRHDPDLGWHHIPSVHISNFFGPDRHVTINSVGARGREEPATEIPAGVTRLLFSGDSFAFGHGIGDDAVWIERLEDMDSRLDVVNLGHEGYGVDQTYLLFSREGSKIKHDVHVYTFITDDFLRATRDRYTVYPKPLLRVHDGRIDVSNVPVPKGSSWRQWWFLNRDLPKELRSIDLLLKLGQRVAADQASPEAAYLETLHASLGSTPLRALVTHVFSDLQTQSRRGDQQLILASLPTWLDYQQDEPVEAWRDFLRSEADRLGVLFFDSVPEFQALARSEAASLFLQPLSIHSHLNEKGNAYLAERFHQWLVAQPSIAARIGQR